MLHPFFTNQYLRFSHLRQCIKQTRRLQCVLTLTVCANPFQETENRQLFLHTVLPLKVMTSMHT